MARNPIERALGVWSAANYRNVTLPGLGVVTCGELCDAIAALQAENEEQRERLIQFANAFDAGYAAAERALAERAGGVKVRHVLVEAGEFVSTVFGENQPARSWAYDLRDKIDAALSTLTTEPAAPEGRQEAMACIACEDKPAVPNDPCAVCGKSARPAEQAVTEALKRIRDYADKPHADRYVIRNMAEDALKAAMEAGRHD